MPGRHAPICSDTDADGATTARKPKRNMNPEPNSPTPTSQSHASVRSAMSSLAINGPPDFAVALLKTLGDPVTSQNTQAIVAWCQREGGAWKSPSHFNPLNTSLRMPGSHAINGDGVQSYTSWSEGLTATVATLNSPSYRRILAALSAGNSVQAVESAVSASPWGTHF